ncbi:GNAT family N-acetyltransferase [Brachybacterium sp. YJGR34]|uniref:GNAT family N-acetyltransferase n=1 Tax=Brachybacterium sp. YJGR34 TaxID=2059911 RepID=UPI000E0AC344|nr:GNAT family N-acetyltransferase [Brachybacterium sp. YJGR34]
MEIHEAREEHLPAITEIHNHAVEHTTAIWNDTRVDLADRARWREERRRAGFPVLVALADGEVLGFASYGPFRPHDGFRRTVEHSVYVRPASTGQGVGRRLMEALLDRARAHGVHVMVAGIDASNTASIRLHEALGFRSVGMLPQVGFKFGRWLDLVFLLRQLDDGPAPAVPGTSSGPEDGEDPRD